VRRDSTEQAFVWAVDKGSARRVNVSVAGQIGDRVRVSGAVSADTTVVISDDAGIRDGTAVRATTDAG
jgi:hypothetical protein